MTEGERKAWGEAARYQASTWHLHHNLQLIKALVMVYDGDELKKRIIEVVKEGEGYVPKKFRGLHMKSGFEV